MNSETPKDVGPSGTPEGSQPASKPPEPRSETEPPASEPESKGPERKAESEASDQERQSKAGEPAHETKSPTPEPASKEAEPAKTPTPELESKAGEPTSGTKSPAPDPASKEAEPVKAPEPEGKSAETASETEPAEPPPTEKPTEPEAAPANDWGAYRRFLRAPPSRTESARTTPEPLAMTTPPEPPRPPTSRGPEPERGPRGWWPRGPTIPAPVKSAWKWADRMAKYAVLLLLALITLRLVFDCYSYYSARRDIDAELQSKRVSSLEYLNVLSQRERALALSTLEARCLERAQLTLFRITEVENAAVQKAYDALMEQKSAMITALSGSGLDPEKLKKITDYINGTRFQLLKLDEHLMELDDGRNSDAVKKLNENLKQPRKAYSDAVLSQAPLRERIEQIMRAYDELVAHKNAMVKILEQSGLDSNEAREAIDYIDGSGFELTQLDGTLARLGAQAGNSDKFTKLKGALDEQHKRYIEIAQKHAALRARLEPLLGAYPPRDPSFWTMDALKTVVDRIDQLRNERKAIRDRYGDIDDVLARYAVWTSALTGGAGDSPVLDEVAYQVSGDDSRSLGAVRCDRFKDYYAAVTRQMLKTADSTSQKPLEKLQLKDIPDAISGSYREYLSWYFKKPPAAQTLMVTLLLGALGALTFNTLRLSRAGWWGANHPDPFWGEIVVGPLLGALAAFGIFLVGSAGLLLTSDARSAQPLSTAFIGLLGFVSGLLYDEAFGRVRRVGTQIFAGTSDVQIAAARTEDRTLAEALKGASASRAADLVLKYGIGTKLGPEKEFTLLFPSDEAIGSLSLAEWNRLNEDRKTFEPWYSRHDVEQRLSRADVTAWGDKPKPKTVGGIDLDLKVEGGVLTVNGIRAVVPDVQWNKGVVHILERDLPSH
jgi:uncharacterized surface protein with fasciclin (FAS1) repeats